MKKLHPSYPSGRILDCCLRGGCAEHVAEDQGIREYYVGLRAEFLTFLVR